MKKLYRSTRDRQLSGVCGGLAEFFGIDSSIVRIIVLILFFAGGSSLLMPLYMILSFVLPTDYEAEHYNRFDNGPDISFPGAKDRPRKDVTESKSKKEDERKWSDF